MKNNVELEKIKRLLDKKVLEYNSLEFIDFDPIQIPHKFTRKEDIEISGLLTATISWGQRKSIIKNAFTLMDLMDNSPYEFIMEMSEINTENLTNDLKRVSQFVHRTFNGADCLFFLQSLQNIYKYHNGLESVFTTGYQSNGNVYGALKHFRNIFLSIEHQQHVRKHISDITTNSSAKRLNMFLRWMVRMDENEVDFGLWKKIPTSSLMLPLDVHTGNVGRELGILHRKQNDWKAVEEISAVLRLFDPIDPIKYDYALFGIGVFDNKPIK